MVPRLFQKSAKVLTTNGTLLMKWLTQRVIDLGKGYRIKYEESHQEALKQNETLRRQPQDRPELWDLALAEISGDTELGRELMDLFPKTGCMAPIAEEFIRLMKDQPVYVWEGGAIESPSLTMLAKQHGFQVGTISSYRHRIGEVVKEGLRRRPDLMAKLEDAQQWA